MSKFESGLQQPDRIVAALRNAAEHLKLASDIALVSEGHRTDLIGSTALTISGLYQMAAGLADIIKDGVDS